MIIRAHYYYYYYYYYYYCVCVVLFRICPFMLVLQLAFMLLSLRTAKSGFDPRRKKILRAPQQGRTGMWKSKGKSRKHNMQENRWPQVRSALDIHRLTTEKDKRYAIFWGQNPFPDRQDLIFFTGSPPPTMALLNRQVNEQLLYNYYSD
jgi:hypothetical protein